MSTMYIFSLMLLRNTIFLSMFFLFASSRFESSDEKSMTIFKSILPSPVISDLWKLLLCYLVHRCSELLYFIVNHALHIINCSILCHILLFDLNSAHLKLTPRPLLSLLSLCYAGLAWLYQTHLLFFFFFGSSESLCFKCISYKLELSLAL